jgi:hypothetical protein
VTTEGPAARAGEPEIMIANEFAAVVVRKVATRNGERLEIRSLGKDSIVRLDAIALEALTWSSAEEIGRALETPLGPEGMQS